MLKKLQILGINGSASNNSSNLAILKHIAAIGEAHFDLTILDDLTTFPPFKTELTNENTPAKIIEFREQISKADGIIICTPEYVFSIPSGLKNVIEWCVSKTVFSDKPLALITASASGEKGHEELQLIMKTVQANFTNETMLLIQGIKGKIDAEGNIIHKETEIDLITLAKSFIRLVEGEIEKTL